MKLKRLILAVSLVVSFSSMITTVNAGSLCTVLSPCTALIIGNTAYQKINRLDNAVNDARVMQSTLVSLGFEVIPREDIATQADMLLALNEFYERLKGKKGIGLFFYAGHGIQVKGENYLIPTQGEVISESDVEYKLLPLKQVLDKMQDAKNSVNIIVVDACRNNPTKGISRTVISDISNGLASVKPPVDSIVIFSTSLSQLASDGVVGGNSPFTTHFSKYIKEPRLKIEDVLKKVREALLKETGYQQLSGEYTTLTKDFCFVSCPAESSDVTAIRAENEDFKVKIAELTKELALLKGYAKKTMKQQIEELRSKIASNNKKIFESTRESAHPQKEQTLKQQLEEMKQRIK